MKNRTIPTQFYGVKNMAQVMDGVEQVGQPPLLSGGSSDILNGKSWQVVNVDCIEHMHALPMASVDMSVFSPPFPSLYAYTNSEHDIGNSEDFRGDAKLHLSYFFKALVRIMKPGRVVCVHCMQIPRLKRCGEVGLHDFRGLLIRLGERAGFTYEFEWVIRKNPQAQAIRTRSRELQFAGLEADRVKTRGCLSDYLIKFVAPGTNEVKIDSPGEISRNTWIQWAEGTWDDIRETDTVEFKTAKGGDDTKHICPLQKPVIHRAIKLFSNPGEIVFSPFTGVGSEGVVAIETERRFYGCELKPDYFTKAIANIESAERKQMAEKSSSLF